MARIEHELDDDDRIMSVVERALERPTAERRAFLEEACSGDTELLGQAWKYIQEEEQLGDYLKEPLFVLLPKLKNTPLSSGSHFGSYEILALIGAGGMGEVYRAHDHKLRRDVAVKILPEAFADSPERFARFQREARVLASLNHPNIAAIYGLEEFSGKQFLVMELVEGETLDQYSKRVGPVLLKDALHICDQIAEGLESAHRKGVTHRDVKPANVKVTPEGRVKVLDFGLAKAIWGAGTDLDVSKTPTVTDLGTEHGQIVGTPAYMSPEQARGKGVDARTDIWAFGCLLYELLTGRKAFPGETLSDTLAAVLNKEPNWDALPKATAPRIRELLRKCLLKDATLRLQDIGEARVAIKDVMEGRRGWSRRRMASAGGVAFVVVLGIAGYSPARRLWRAGMLPAQKHVAVVPFRSVGGDASQQAFCDGLTETLTTALSKHGELSVVPAAESRRLEDVQQARRQFGVNLVVSGTLQRRGDQVRLTLSLIDAETNRQIDAEPIDWPVTKLFEIEDAVLQKLADLLNLVLTEPPQDRPAANASHNPSAYDAYLRGRGFLYHYDRPGNLDRALQEFEDAAQFDPQFALAYVGQAETELRMYRLRRGESDLLQRAHSAAEKARDLNPQLPAAHVVLGGIWTDLGQNDNAIRELKTALQRDPRDPAVYTELGRLYGRLGRHTEAEDLYAKAIAQRPGDWRTYRAAATYYTGVQQLAKAERYSRKVLDLAPDNSEGYMNLGALLLKLGQQKEGERMLLKAQNLNPTASGYANLAYLYMGQHRFPEAVVVMEKSAAIAEHQQSGEFRIWGNLGDAYWLAHADSEKARQAWSRAASIVRDRLGAAPAQDTELLSYLAKFEAKAGESGPASRHLDTALAQGKSNANTQYQAALAYAVLGRADDSLHALATAIELKYPVDEIQQAPELATVRADRRYSLLFSQRSAKP